MGAKDKMTKRYHTVIDGEPYYPTLKNHYEVCCDCGAAHRVCYDIEDSHGKKIKGAVLKISAWRADNHTREARKKIKIHFSSVRP